MRPKEPSAESAVRAAYDAVAAAYAAQFAGELADKPFDRSVLTTFLDLVGPGVVADVGCGPGHVTQFLADRHEGVIGIDLSPAMIDIARRLAPSLSFAVASMLALPVSDGVWAGAVAPYSVIHFTADQRALAFREMARAIRSGGWLLLAFHVDSAEFAAGEVNHLATWFGQSVDLDGYFLDPAVIRTELCDAGFEVTDVREREPLPEIEYPSRRAYVFATRSAAAGAGGGAAHP